MTDLTQLIDKLEKAEAGSRELDGYVAVALGWRHNELGDDLDKFAHESDENGPIKWMSFGDCFIAPGDLSPYDFLDKNGKPSYREASSAGRWDFPKCTTSLDAAIDLLERVLPGWSRKTEFAPNEECVCFVSISNGGFYIEYTGDVNATANTEPLALCACLLKAIQAKEAGQ